MINFKVGDRVRLDYMGYDPRPIEVGTLGTVQGVDSIGTVHIQWDNGRTLGVVLGIDKISKVR